MLRKKEEYCQYRPFVIHARKQNKTIGFSTLETYKINQTKIEFVAPNIITLFLDISHREFINANGKYDTLIKHRLSGNKLLEFEGDDLTALYDYLETIQISVIFAYNSIEAFCNLAIPDDFVYETKNSKGISESWNKESIQRWMSTADKLVNILPMIRKIDSPSDKPFWSDFKNLERLRNEIIHPKQLNKKPGERNAIHKDFFDYKVFKWIKSTKEVLNYLCQGEFAEPYFPPGFGSNKIKAIKIDDFNEYFREIEK